MEFNQTVSLEEVLANKERRVREQRELLKEFPRATLLSLSLNIPGNVKHYAESYVLFQVALEQIEALHVKILERSLHVNKTGAEALFVCECDAVELKKLTCKIENEHPLGRVMDIDVINSEFNILSRTSFAQNRRKCFICDEDAINCGRTQKHSYNELTLKIKSLVKEHAFSKWLCLHAKEALIKEVELTPKPGLVDKKNSGSHQDMDIFTFYKSIEAITPFFEKFFQAGVEEKEDANLFLILRKIGKECEKKMFEATKGINTHKGAIFCFALLFGSFGSLHVKQKKFTCKALQNKLQSLCENLIEDDLINQKQDSAGGRFFAQTSHAGIRQYASEGFRIVFEGSLPFYEQQLSCYTQEVALKRTLLWLMAKLEDTTLWSRGGLKALEYVQEKSKKLLEQNEDFETALEEFDRDLISKNLSAGGSADLLALTWFASSALES